MSILTQRLYHHVLDGRAYAAAETLTFFGPKSGSGDAGRTSPKGPKTAQCPPNGILAIVSTRAQKAENERENATERWQSGLLRRS